MRNLKDVITDMDQHIPVDHNNNDIKKLRAGLHGVFEGEEFNALENQNWDIVTYWLKAYARSQGKIRPVWFEKVLQVWRGVEQ